MPSRCSYQQPAGGYSNGQKGVTTVARLRDPIATGRSAEIYEWGEGQVLKLFLASVPVEWAKAEASIGRMVHAAGLPVPAVGEIVEVAGRPGIVLERLVGPSLLDVMSARPWAVFHFAGRLARLHAEIHSHQAPPDLLPQREWIMGVCQLTKSLPANLRGPVLTILDSLPQGDQLCHGDFHPGNIMMTKRGPFIIDWLGAHRGCPVGDLARSSVLMCARSTPGGTPNRWLVELMRRWFHASYLKQYFALCSVDRDQFVSWRAVMAASFLKWVSPAERPLLIQMVKAGLGPAK